MLCSAQNDTTLTDIAHRDALRDSMLIDNIKKYYLQGLEYEEIAELEKSSTLRRSAYQCFVKVLSLLEESNMPYNEYYAAAAFHAGNIQYNSGNYSTAYSCFEVAHKYSPKNIEYLTYLAYMNEHFDDASRNKAAIDNYKELIQLDPDKSIYHLHLYYLYGKQNNYKAAKNELDRYTHTEGEGVQSIEPYLNLYEAMNKPQKAIEYLKGFIERNPASRIEAELYLSRYLLSRNQNKEAFDYLIKNLGQLPTHDLTSLLNPYIQTILETKDTARVVTFLDTLQTIHNDKLEVFQYSYDVRKSINDTIGIVAVLQHMYQLGQEDENVYQSLAEYYQSHSMKDELYEIAVKGDSLFDNEIWTYYHIISTIDTANYERFIETATSNVNRLSNKVAKSVIYTFIAEYYNIKLDKLPNDTSEQYRQLFTLELATYDSALTLNPNNTEALNNYAFIIATTDSVTESNLIRAERMAAKAVKLEPSATFILDTYAWILHLRGDNVTARIYIDKMIRLSENNSDKMTATEYYHIYKIYEPLDANKAKHYLELLREEYKNNPNAVNKNDKCRQEIEKLLGL